MTRHTCSEWDEVKFARPEILEKGLLLDFN